MKTYISIVVTCIIFLSLLSCNNQPSSNHSNTKADYSLWADTIIYEVLINNPDTLNEWESQKVKAVHQLKIVDELFDKVYNKEKIAYDYYTNEKLSIDDIRSIESKSEFNRKNVGKLQFSETWKFDNKTNQLHKEILQILLAYEIYDETGNLRGYRAAFYLKDF